jgi:hypothetical protein
MIEENVTIEQWVRYLFDRPVTDPGWYWTEEFEYLDPGPVRTAELIAETYERSGELMAPFSDAQLNDAFWFSVANNASDYMFVLRNESVPWDLRCRALWSFVPLFEGVMAARCTPTLSHLDEKPASRLNASCYMWWDIIPIHASRKHPEWAEFDAQIIAVMDAILKIPHDACRESALHGLGHWSQDYDCSEIIDEFLDGQQSLRPELVAYAENAKGGCVL